VARLKRRQPYNPALAEYQRQQAATEETAKRSRIATEFNKGIARHIGTMTVEDPFDGSTIEVARQTRNDPLGRLHGHKSIDEAQYQGGRAFQRDFETIEGGAKAIDPSQPYVDCSRRPRGVSAAYSGAWVRLNAAHEALGQDGSALIHDVLVRGWSYRQIAEARGYGGERWEKFFGTSVQLHLHRLSYVYGFATEKTGKQRMVEKLR